MAAFLRKDFMYLVTRNFSSSFRCKHSLPSKNKHISTTPVYDFLLHQHHFSPVAATELASVIPPLKDPEKSNSLLSFLKRNDFSNSHLEKILKYKPIFIWDDLEKSVEPKIKILQELGLPNYKIADLFKANPSLFDGDVNTTMLPAISVLRGLLGSGANVVKVLMKKGLFLTVVELDKCLVPNIEFLKSRSVSMKQIIRAVYDSERFMVQKPEFMRSRAERAEELGVKPGSGMYFYAVKVMSSMSDEAWELKLQVFRSLGFSEDDILNAFRRCPMAFAVSVKKMRQVMDVLVSSKQYDVVSIVNCPECFTTSIEKKYKPRLQVLAALEDKKLIENWPSLSVLCASKDMSFYTKFVAPYMDEVGHLWNFN